MDSAIIAPQLQIQKPNLISRAIWIMLYPIKSCRLPRACILIQVVAWNARSCDSIISSLGQAKRNIAKKRFFQTSLSAKSCQCETRKEFKTQDIGDILACFRTPIMHIRARCMIYDLFELGDICKVTCEGSSLPQRHKKKTGDLTVLSCIPQTPKIVYDRLMETDGSITHILHEYTQNHPREEIPTQLRSRAPRRFVPPQRHCLTVGETCLTQIGKDRLTQHISGCVT